MIAARLLLLDTNVWVDYYLGEEKGKYAKRLIELAARGKTQLLYTPTTAKDLFYLLPRRMRENEEQDSKSYVPAAWGCINHLMQVATASPLSAAECELARMLGKRMPDLEDNLIIASAETAKADYVVTSDKRMVKAMPEVCITPERAVELVELLS